MLLKEEASNFLKMKFLSSLMRKNFSSRLTWKLSWTPFQKFLVARILFCSLHRNMGGVRQRQTADLQTGR